MPGNFHKTACLKKNGSKKFFFYILKTVLVVDLKFEFLA